MTNIKPSCLEGVPTNGADRESAVEQSGAKPAEIVPFTDTPKKNSATAQLERRAHLDQAILMAMRPNGRWKAWLQVACGFSRVLSTYSATAAISKVNILWC
ncbi:hypothetical protein ACSS6W_004299 [Trichoderma asperelloides]